MSTGEPARRSTRGTTRKTTDSTTRKAVAARKTADSPEPTDASARESMAPDPLVRP